MFLTKVLLGEEEKQPQQGLNYSQQHTGGKGREEGTGERKESIVPFSALTWVDAGDLEI